jgi:hypothetical protein
MTNAEQFRAALRTVHPDKLPAEDVETILAIAQMAVDADGQEDAEEIQAFFALGKAVYELAGIMDASTPTFFNDEDDLEAIRQLGAQLTTQASREVAYAAAHLLTVIDVQIAPEEDDFLEDLRTTFGITPDRAGELATMMGAAITPLA